MKILVSAAVAIAAITATQSAMAADLNMGPPVVERSRPVYRQAYVVAPIWWAQPADILYKYAPEYPGWRGDAYYYNCGSVREILPDGRVIRRRAC